MPFKKLNLNVPQFDNTLKNYPKFSRMEKDEKTQVVNYTIYIDDKIVKLAVYFNKNGTTTINPNVGGEVELGTNIALFLKDTITVSDVKQACFSIKDISETDFELLKDYLSECDITATFKNATNGVKFLFKSPHNDEITVTRYSNGNTLFQGKPLYIFSEIKIFLIEILELKQLIDIENEVYKVNISVEEIKDELNQILINSNGYLTKTIKKMLSSSLALKKISVEMEDYTYIAFPSLRALEGYLKMLFSEKGIVLDSNGFDQFDKNEGTFTLKTTIKTQISCSKSSNAIEKCYNYFNKNRHTLFHTKNITDASRIITDRNEAIQIVDNIFKIIEETYNDRL